MNKRKIIFFIVLFVLIIITTLFNYYINYTTNLVVNINDYKCEFVNNTTIDDKKCNILIKTLTNEYYSVEISNNFSNITTISSKNNKNIFTMNFKSKFVYTTSIFHNNFKPITNNRFFVTGH